MLWPDAGITKSDLAEYFDRMAPWLLPWLADRPVTLVRYPDGIDGESFFQKNAPASAPAWIRIESLASGSGSVTDYLVLETPEALAYVANLAAIELHVTASTLADPERPTWFVIDLDPKEAPYAWVVKAAKEILRICKSIDLPAYVKTSGATGLHILVPGGGALDFEQGTMLTVLIARLLQAVQPERRRSSGASNSAAARCISIVARTGAAPRWPSRTDRGRVRERLCQCHCGRGN